MTQTQTTANRQIARAAGTVMFAFVLSNLTGLARQMLMYDRFGTTGEMDAFNIANQVSETLFTLVAGGALGSAFIPTFTGLLVHDDRKSAWKLASALANLILLILTAAAALAAVFAREIVHYGIATGFASDPAKEALAVSLLRLMLPSAVIFGLSGLVMGILNSHQVFLVPALAPSMYQLGLIFGVVVLSRTMGIFGLAWGVLIGASLHLALQLPALFRKGIRYIPTLGFGFAPLWEVIRLMGPRFLGVAVVQINFWVNKNLASLQVEGSISAIEAAFRLMMMPQIAIAQSIATAAMPTYSEQVARGRLDEMRVSLAASLRAVLLLSLPASLGLILLRQPLIKLIYERGVFTSASTDLVAWALLWFAAGLVGHSLVEILARAFYALHDTKTPVIVGIIAMSLNIAFSIGFSALFERLNVPPHGGLALANSLATGLEAIALLILMRRRLNGLNGRDVLKGVIQACLAGSAMSLALWLLIRQTTAWPQEIVAVAGVIVGAGVYLLSAWVVGVREMKLNRFFR